MTDTRREQLIRLLADGEIHSGAALAKTMNVSRTAVWKQLRRCDELGLELEALPGRGYRLMRGIDLLDAAAIRRSLAAGTKQKLDALTVESVLESTNDTLRGSESPVPGRIRALLAEYQTGGRGRRGRSWLSPFGAGLCLSVATAFDPPPAGFAALGLAAGVAARRAVAEFGVRGALLKWPNDVMCDQRKLAGLLVEVSGESGGPLAAVIGIGINIDLPADIATRVTRAGGVRPVDLRELLGADCPSRNLLAARLIDSLAAMLADFSASGFAGIAEEWRSHDALAGQQVEVQSGRQSRMGLARGVDDNGALLIEAAGTTDAIVAGEVTVRVT